MSRCGPEWSQSHFTTVTSTCSKLSELIETRLRVVVTPREWIQEKAKKGLELSRSLLLLVCL